MAGGAGEGTHASWAPPVEHVVLEGDDGSMCWVTLHGAQVVRWTGPGGDDRLFLSTLADWAPPAALRGGIPLCWPQFNDRGPLAKHGFARNKRWNVEEVGVSEKNGKDRTHRVVLKLCGGDDTRDADGFPPSFTATVSIQLLGAEGSMRTELNVKNESSEEMRFSFAFHTYFAIGNIRECSVRGLKGCPVINCVKKKANSPGVNRPIIPKPSAHGKSSNAGGTPVGGSGERDAVEESDEVKFVYETDRIYTDVKQLVTLVDHRNHRRFEIARSNLPDCVVWNPDIDKARAMKDLEDNAYTQFCCVEPGRIAEPCALQTGEQWAGSQTIQVVSHHT